MGVRATQAFHSAMTAAEAPETSLRVRIRARVDRGACCGSYESSSLSGWPSRGVPAGTTSPVRLRRLCLPRMAAALMASATCGGSALEEEGPPR